MPRITRRRFIAGGASLAAAATGGALPGRAPGANGRPTLPVPPELRADATGTIALQTEKGVRRFLPGVETPTYGFNGPYLGPALRVRRGEKVVIRATNRLGEDVSMHWHGLKIPGAVDGGPYNLIKPGRVWDAQLSIEQPAATCWFHPHVYPATAEQVLKGLAGLFLIDDDEAGGLGLPSKWGVDDIPLILQDRRFNPDGSFFHRFNMVAITTGYVGDAMLVNGAIYPQTSTARGWLRFRLLNGSNARTYRVAISDGRSMYVVASDGGLLEQPVELAELQLYSGERYEILVDARNGAPFDLVTLPVRQLAMNLPPFDKKLPLVTFVPDGAAGTGKLPEALVKLPPLVPDLPPVSQRLVMGMRLDDEGMGLLKAAGLMEMGRRNEADPAVVQRVVKLITEGQALLVEQQLHANTINGEPFKMGVVPFGAVLNRNERWVISEGSDRMLHPVHIHGCQFRIQTLNGKPPPAYAAGWKDIAPIENGASCEIQVRFEHPADKQFPFMAHCHNLEHEDSGMMTAFTVS